MDSRASFVDILLRKKILSREQYQEAHSYHQKHGLKIEDAIAKLGYASTGEVMEATAEAHGMEFVDLAEVTIPSSVIELVPESVARENIVLPLGQENGTLMVIMSDPNDLDTIQKLQFILNKDILPVLATREQTGKDSGQDSGKTTFVGLLGIDGAERLCSELLDFAIDSVAELGRKADPLRQLAEVVRRRGKL